MSNAHLQTRAAGLSVIIIVITIVIIIITIVIIITIIIIAIIMSSWNNKLHAYPLSTRA